MTSPFLLLRALVERGDVLLTTPRHHLTPADVRPDAAHPHVTATIWNPTTAAWHQHYASQLDTPAVEAILQHAGEECHSLV